MSKIVTMSESKSVTAHEINNKINNTNTKEKENGMNILLIGNGFDLAHDLKTDYGSFLTFMKLIEKYNNKCKSDDERENISRHEKYVFCFDYVEDLFAKDEKKEIRDFLIHAVRYNKWIKFFQTIYLNRKQKGKTGWIDFESEISGVIQILDEIKSVVSLNTIFRDKDIEVADELTGYVNQFVEGKVFSRPSRRGFFSLNQLDEIEEYLFLDLSEMIRCLEIYLTDYIESQHIISRLPDIKELRLDRILSFNYTDTCEKYYFPECDELKYDYIHGEAKLDHTVDTCNMVLGIDEYLKESERERIDFIRFKKYYQRIYKKTGCAYRDWIAVMNKNAKIEPEGFNPNHLYIFGHSLDVTDADVLYSLIMAPKMITTIYYHNQKAFSQQIANLVRIIGPDTLTAMVHGQNPRIKFEQQQEAVKIK